MKRFVLPWAAASSSGVQRDVKWAEGLRGIASVFVVTSHLCRAFAPTLITPAQDNIQRGNIFHLPFLRLPAQGAPWVALFFLLTGYVNSMRPIKQARNGSINPALSGLASSTLRRTGRLVLPATIATLLSWLLCQVGAFDVGTKCDAAWVRDTSPAPGPGLEGSLRMLASNVYTTWTSGANEYDKNQWTFAFFLKGSMLIYVTLLATVRTQPRYRMLVFLGLYAYSWAGRDPMVGLNIYFGAALAELSNQLSSSPAPSRPNPLNHLLPWFLLLVGLYVSGYPELSPDWTAWSQNLANIGLHIFPSPNDHWRFWTSVGVQLVTVAVVLYPMFQKFLSHPALVWLGGLSFPLYLIHGPLIRTVLAWMLFGWQEPQYFYNNDENGNVTDKWVRIPFPSGWVFCIALPVYFVLLFWLSHLWSLWIDPWCASKVKNLEEIMYGDVSSEKLERPRKESGHLLCAV